jgi:predicted DNA-binding transcriptional regulator YafY
MTRRELRNIALAGVAQATGKSVRFTYTNRQGATKRRTAKPVGLRPTRLGVMLLAEDIDGPKNFRLDRIFRTTIV